MTKSNCQCLKCGKKWYSQIFELGRLPRACPACHRYDWMEPRIRKRKKS